jgi:hypothetical protein
MSAFWTKKNTDAGDDDAGPIASERPDWLAEDDAENPSVRDWHSTEVTTSAKTTSLTEDPLASPPITDDDKPSPGRFKSIFLFAMSVTLLVLFIYSVITQRDDKDRIEWSIFYGTSAGIPVLFLCHWLVCFPDKVIYLMSAGMAVWAIIYIVLLSLDLKDIPSNTDGSDDARQDLILELAGASLVLFSALYHPIVMRCCVKK